MSFEISTCSYEELTESEWEAFWSVTRTAFKEHKSNGLDMYPCRMSLEQLKVFLHGCTMFIVRDGDRIVAFRGAHLRKEGNLSYFAGQLVAVLPEYKGKGLGRLLFQAFEGYALSVGCDFLQTDTSCQAKSSLAYHRSCGFEDWCYASWSNTNYYTIILRKLLPAGRRYSSYVRYYSLIKSYLYIHFRYDRFGRERLMFRCLKVPYKLLRSLRRMES